MCKLKKQHVCAVMTESRLCGLSYERKAETMDYYQDSYREFFPRWTEPEDAK